MYIKNALIVLFMIISTTLFGQIKVDDVGDGWKAKVDSALVLIKTYDSVKYELVLKECKTINFWLGDFSSNLPPNTILISVKDLKLGSINNIACVIVHESLHLNIASCSIKMDQRLEEYTCYKYELEFLTMLPNVEPWLKSHTYENMLKFQ